MHFLPAIYEHGHSFIDFSRASRIIILVEFPRQLSKTRARLSLSPLATFLLSTVRCHCARRLLARADDGEALATSCGSIFPALLFFFFDAASTRRRDQGRVCPAVRLRHDIVTTRTTTYEPRLMPKIFRAQFVQHVPQVSLFLPFLPNALNHVMEQGRSEENESIFFNFELRERRDSLSRLGVVEGLASTLGTDIALRRVVLSTIDDAIFLPCLESFAFLILSRPRLREAHARSSASEASGARRDR